MMRRTALVHVLALALALQLVQCGTSPEGTPPDLLPRAPRPGAHTHAARPAPPDCRLMQAQSALGPMTA
jgi:hypothetical protein